MVTDLVVVVMVTIPPPPVAASPANYRRGEQQNHRKAKVHFQVYIYVFYSVSVEKRCNYVGTGCYKISVKIFLSHYIYMQTSSATFRAKLFTLKIIIYMNIYFLFTFLLKFN